MKSNSLSIDSELDQDVKLIMSDAGKKLSPFMNLFLGAAKESFQV